MTTQAATIAVIDWLLAARRPQAAPSPDGRFGLGYSRRYRVTIAVSLVAATGFLIGGILVLQDDLKAFLVGNGVFGAMWLGIAYYAWDAFCVRLSFSELQLVRESLLGTPLAVSWGEIARFRFSSTSNLFTFSTIAGRHFRVSLFRDGLETLAEVSTRRLGGLPVTESLRTLHEKARNPQRVGCLTVG